jgi:hypothetical protein
MSRWRGWIAGGALALGAATLVALVSWHVVGPRRTPVGQPPLVRLTAENFDELRAAFNAHADKTRFVVLLSPT